MLSVILVDLSLIKVLHKTTAIIHANRKTFIPIGADIKPYKITTMGPRINRIPPNTIARHPPLLSLFIIVSRRESLSTICRYENFSTICPKTSTRLQTAAFFAYSFGVLASKQYLGTA